MSLYLTDKELKDLILLNGKRMSSEYMDPDTNRAYEYSVRRCGFENPAESDDDYTIKQHWLIEISNLYFYYDQLRLNTPKFDVEGLKLSQVARGLRELIKDIETAFVEVKEGVEHAHIFIDASAHFGTSMVVGSGLVDDAVGQDYRTEDDF